MGSETSLMLKNTTILKPNRSAIEVASSPKGNDHTRRRLWARSSGFPAGGSAHHLENRTTGDVMILEVGDRSPGDAVFYPDDDLAAAMGPDGKWQYTRKDGSAL